jgi:hypothetical protein
MSRHRLLLAPVVAAAALVVATAAPASAKVVETFSLDDSFAGQTDPGFCGVAGLVVDFTYDQTGVGRLFERGKDRQLSFQGHTRVVQTFTYQGRTVTNLMPRILEKDLKIVDNGDGTLDLTVLFTGAERTLNEEGRIIAKNDGQLRQLWVVDAETTAVLSRETIKESTGTNDDFCAAVLADWGL